MNKLLLSLGRAVAPTLVLAAAVESAQAQVGIGTTTPDAKAVLDLQSAGNDKGLLIPRLTNAQRLAMSSVPDGLMIFQTDGTAGFWYYFGGQWNNLPNATTAGDNLGNHTATQTLNLGTNKLAGTNTAGSGLGGLVLNSAGKLGVNSATAPLGYLDVQGGDNGNGTLGLTALSFQYAGLTGGVGLGGYRHFVRSRHNSNLSGSGNALDFYLNNSNSLTGSLAAGTGSLHVLTMENNGAKPRVGIGTTAPDQTLDVNGGAEGFVTRLSSSSSTGTRFSLRNSSTGGGTWQLLSTGSANSEGTGNFVWVDPTGNSRMRLLSGGQLGIGAFSSTTPTATLDVDGTARVRSLNGTGTLLVTADASGNLGTTAAPTGESTTASNGLTRTGSDVALGGTLSSATTIAQGSNNFNLTGTGNVGIGTTAPSEKLHVEAGSVYVNGESAGLIVDSEGAKRIGLVKYVGREAGIWRTPDANNLFEIGRVQGVTSLPGTPTGFLTDLAVNNNGYVGIGTAAPATTLHVAGTAGTPNVRLESLAGTGTRVVTTDASGNLSTTTTASLADNLGNHNATTNVSLAGNDILLRGTSSSDTNHGLGYYGSVGKAWSGVSIDGPVLYGYGGGILGINLNGTQQSVLLWNNAGNVGIGTTSPAKKLDVSTTSEDDGVRVSNPTHGTSAALFTNANGPYLMFSNGSYNNLGINGWIQQRPATNANPDHISYHNNNGTTHAFTASTGVRVGIGTTAPEATLHVEGSTSTVRLAGLAGAGTRMVTTDASGNLSAAAVPADAQQLSISGSTLSLTNGGSVTVPSGADNLGNHTATQDLNLNNHALLGALVLGNGSSAVHLPGDGRVGINTNNPVATLHLNGASSTVRFDGLGGAGTRVVTANDYGDLGTTSITGETTTASNGLTRTGTDVALGGTLTSATTIVQGGNSLGFTGGNVGIGTSSPAVLLDVNGETNTGSLLLDRTNANTGSVTSAALRFGNSGTGEGIGSARNTGNPNQFGLDFYTGYANRLAIANSGNVGIGTTAPTALLDVNGSTRLRGLTTAGVVTTDASGNLSSVASSTLGDNLGNHTATQDLNMNGFNLYNAASLSNGSGSLNVLSSGRVGINTTNPVATLHVNGAASTVRFDRLAGSGTRVVTADDSGELNTTTTASLRDNLGNHTATQDLNLGTNYLSGTSAVNLNTNLSLSDNDVLLRGANSGDTNHGLGYYGPSKLWNGVSVDGPVLYGYTSGILGTNAGGTKRSVLTWNNSGNVGIGVFTPAATLHVAGTAGTSNVRLESLAGTDTRMVTADNNGNLSSAAVPTGESTTASNGLTRTGVNVALGGTLSSATTIANGGNTFAITGTGNVGIGTSSPALNLDVVGSLGLRNTAAWDHLYLAHSGSVAALNAGGADTGLALRVGIGNTGTYNDQTYTDVMRLLPSGNVGIGTTTPATTLHVAGTAGTSNVRLESLGGTGVRYVTTDASGNLSTSAGPTNGESTTASNGLTLSGTAVQLGGTLTQATAIATAGFAFGLTGTGRFGLGTSAPIARLHSQGESSGNDTQNDYVLEDFRAGGNTTQYMVQRAANGTAAAPANLGNGTTTGINIGGYMFSPRAGGSYAGTGYTETGMTGLYRGDGTTGLTELQFRTTGATRLTLDPTGQLGLGTTSPAVRLHVAGTSGTSNVRLESLGGTGTRMVTADASGNLSSATVPTDAQTLSISGSTISLTNGGSVVVPSSADNLGNHTATTALNLGANKLVGNGGSTGLGVASNGNVSTDAALSALGTVYAGGGIILPHNFGPDAAYVGSTGNSISFGHQGVSEDFIGYANNTFYLRDSPGGGDGSQPTLNVGSLAGTGTRFVTADASGNLSASSTAQTESTTAANGLTLSGTQVQLGGTLSTATTVALAGNSLLFGGTGNVGIGTAGAAGSGRLSISPTLTEAKLTLFDNGDAANHYGLGVSSNQLNYHVRTTAASHVFYGAGKNGDGTELLRVKGSGEVQVAGLSGTDTRLVTADASGNLSTTATITGESTTAGSGLTLSGTQVKLGGTLAEGTTLATDGNSLAITGTGNVGIGTTAGSAKLTISHPNNDLAVLQGTSASGTWLGLQNSSGRRWNLISTGTSNSEGAGKLLIQDGNGGGVRATFDASGNMGVGTTSPGSTLTVSGTTAFTPALSIAGGTAASPTLLSLTSATYLGLLPANATNNNYRLPDPATSAGRMYVVRNNSGANPAVLTTAAGSLVNGSGSGTFASYTLNPNSAGKTLIVFSDGVNWTVGQLN